MNNNKKKKIVIVGAGIAGLSAGCYAQMNGFETEIFEQHNLPGGLCTAWKRKGYTFDGCIHWLEGSAPPNSFFTLWREIGAVQNRQFIYPDAFTHMTGSDGREFILYTDPNKLEAHIRQLSPQDGEPAAQLCRWIRKFSRFNMDMTGIPGQMSILKMLKTYLPTLPFLPSLGRISRLNVGDFTATIKDPLIRETFNNSIGKDMSLLALIFTMASMAGKTAGYPLGGSLPFARAIEERYIGLGGQVHYQKPVKHLLTNGSSSGNNGRKTQGVTLEDGTQIDADIVISAADLRWTIDKLLEGKFPSPAHEQLFMTTELVPSAIQISFGLDKRYEEDLNCINSIFQLDPPVTQGGLLDQMISVRNYGSDPNMAPADGSVIVVHSSARYDYWARLKHGSAAYKAEVESLTWIIQRKLESIYPDFSEHVVVSDMATPLTFERYTRNYLGSFMTWSMNKNNLKAVQTIPNTIPGLSDFFMAGMWLMGPGGLPAALKTARDTVAAICRQEGQKFLTSFPSTAP